MRENNLRENTGHLDQTMLFAASAFLGLVLGAIYPLL
jgi:hypothetical protein